MVERQPQDLLIHEFNNLLTIIVGFTDLLLDDALPGGQVYADLKEIRVAAARALELLPQLGERKPPIS